MKKVKGLQLNEIEFREIERDETKEILLNYHYLQRMPNLSVAFGAFHLGELVGVITFGKPASYTLCNGIAGKGFSSNVYELNRLYTFDDTPRNLESKFISYALKKLKNDKVLSEDEFAACEKDVEKMVADAVQKTDVAVAEKEKEVMTV